MPRDPLIHGGLITGSDGHLQGRKLAALLCFVLGLGLLIHGATLPLEANLECRVGPALVALVFSLLFWGLLTVQNVMQLVAVVRGLKPEADRDS